MNNQQPPFIAYFLAFCVIGSIYGILFLINLILEKL